MSISDSVITAVERHPKTASRYLIFVDGQYAFTVHEDVLVKHRLLKGERVEADKLRRVMEDEEQQKAWSEALRQVGRRPRTEKELRQYLRRKGYLMPLIDRIVRRLKEQRYLDDADFAAAWTEQRIYSQKKGRMLIRQELQQKGVCQDMIRHTLEQVPADDERRLACELALKKWQQTSGDAAAKKRKTAAFLMRRGYSAQIAAVAVRQAAEAFREQADEGDEADAWDWPET